MATSNEKIKFAVQMLKQIFILIFFVPNLMLAQTLKGIVTDKNNAPIEAVNVSVIGKQMGSSTNEKGEYQLHLKANRSFVISFTFIGYQPIKIRIPMLKMGQDYVLNQQMIKQSFIKEEIIIQDKQSRKKTLSRIKPKHAAIIPSSIGGVEALLKTLPGVSSANELSAQYSVRGGNFDENLVYVNGIEVYRPFLVRSGQQEGLSFINPDLVGSILFSAGGFDAKYGDKMSSVLDIKYKTPKRFGASANFSLLGGSAHFEGKSKNNRFSFLTGIRRKTTQYILGSLDTEADYKPVFTDIQTFINYEIGTDWSVSFLGNISNNTYQMVPKNRDTEFGTLNEALKLTIYFDGQEIDTYKTYFGALSSSYHPNDKLQLKFTTSAFRTLEQENFDIMGQYWLYQLDNSLGSDNFGDVKYDRGVGTYINHARNSLNATVLNFQHSGIFNSKEANIQWGFRVQKEEIEDKISEWNLIDSAGFTLPHTPDSVGYENPVLQAPLIVSVNDLLKTTIHLSSFRNSAYLQYSKDIGNFSLTSGFRGNYWSFNEELVLSPRVSLAYIPNWEKDVVFKAAAGIYYQPAFYKELRDFEGNINRDIKAQKSIHYIVGADYLFYSWGRPFKWVSEIYYKQLENLIPYKVDNVRIRYLSNEIANGYATGIDMKINGEFVPGIESWASMSVLKTEEDIVGDYYTDANGNEKEAGYIPRPTDQRVNFSLFFQDYIPRNPSYKMHLNLVYGTGLTFGPPKSEKHQDILRIPPYRRVDIGFSKEIIKEGERKKGFCKHFNSIWLSLEVFNLLQINNTVSYLWVSDVSGRQYAVPNYLTARQINIKLIFSF
ncbi:MAG TPA: TonB-dependent receptor [Flavobacteriales bacterium]|nr:TonB-dependent receptor [Flavobacteriales bacterium]